MARHDGGWIKLHRAIMDGDIPDRGPFTFWIFCRILAMANWKEGSAYFSGKQIRLQPGQLITGLAELRGPDPERLDPHLHRTRSALTYLEDSARIAQTVSNQGRLITVVNWETYQRDEILPASDEQSDRKQGANEPQLSEEGKKERTKKGSRREPAHRLNYPEDFESLWNLYGQVGKKKQAFEIFDRLSLDAIEKEQLVSAAKTYVIKKPDKQYRMHLSTFLNEDWRVHLQRGPSQPRLKGLDDADAIARGEAS